MTGSLHLVPPARSTQTEKLPTTAPGGIGRRHLFDGTVSYGVRSREHPEGVAAHDLDDHVLVYGPRPTAAGHHGEDLIDTLQELALTGRGGGHFPVAAKWRAVLRAGGGGLVVANGAEGEPASAKDAALLQLRPHLVLDGLALAAEAVGADTAVVWLHEGDIATHRAVTLALAERRAARAPDVTVRVATGPDAYLTGESSAVVRALSGGPALPYAARRPAAESGVGGRPTLLHNAETLARVALAAGSGGGPGAAPGTLLTVLGTARRVVLEARPGQTLGGIALVALGGEDRGRTPAAVLVGGFGGSWLPWSTVATLPPTEPALRRVGASLGAGVVLPLPVGGCGLAETALVLSYLAASGARQCGPCLFGLPALVEVMTDVAAGAARRSNLRRFERLAGQVDGRGACHHPDGAVRLVRTALAVFADDVRRHRVDGPCLGALRPPTFPVPDAG